MYLLPFLFRGDLSKEQSIKRETRPLSQVIRAIYLA